MEGRFSVARVLGVDDAALNGLTGVLLDAVNSGASVGFMAPLEEGRARAFWERVAADVQNQRRLLMVATDASGVCGTVQLVLDVPDNQPHRADLCKMLVHRRARRLGLGEALMRAVEAEARRMGRTLLVLDAVTDGDAARLYARLGWVRVGDIPGYALFPDGRPCGTTYFYRDLR